MVQENKRISIIIPVYNVAGYIEKCIYSIANQDFCFDEIEIIAVNDGTTDQSRVILGELQKKYTFIRIIDKENGGLSSARNAGIEAAKGDYIFFLDADDYIAEDSLSFLIEWINEYPVDILMFGVSLIYDNGKTVSLANNFLPDNKITSAAEYLNTYTVRSSGCMSLFCRKLFTEYNIRMKDGYLSEDDDFIVRIFSVADKIVCNKKTVYFYYQRSGSLSKSAEYDSKIIADKLQILTELDIYIRQFDGELRKGLERKLNFLALDIVRLLIRKNQPSEFIDEILSQLFKIGYYPLKKGSYSSNYTIFRWLFCNPFTVKKLRILKKYI